MATRSSSGRVIKKNRKYGEIQGQTFDRVVQRMVGPDPMSVSDDEYDSESLAAGGVGSDEADESKLHTIDPDLGPDDINHCLICWSPCTPAPAAASAYNRLNGYLAEHGDSPVQMIIGALGVDLDAAAKYELMCPICAAIVRELEEREQQVQALREQLLQRFTRSQQSQSQESHQERREEELVKALQAFRADSQDGMFGVTGLGLPLPKPPPSFGHSSCGPHGPGGELLSREEDTVEAYLSRRDEWITQTPGATSGLVQAIVEASADGMGTRAGPHVQPYPCTVCERVFSSPEALTRHEYFQHHIGELRAPAQAREAGGKDESAAVAVELVMEDTLVERGEGDQHRYVVLQEEEVNEEEDDEETEEDAGTPVESISQGTPEKRRRGRPRLPKHLALRSGKCQYCGTFIKVDLQGHINRFHTMVRPHSCDLCGERLVSRHALTEHKKIVHGTGRPCEHCGATFTRKKQLSVHLWRKHGIGGVQCRICGKKFARSDTLDGHMRCHDRPMQCSLCPARYPFKRELRNHEYLKHGLHGEIPRDSDYRPGEMYRCGKCGRCFGSWAGRDKHTCDSAAALSDLYVCQLCGDWSTRFEGDMVKHMRNLHKIEAETILIADVEEAEGVDGGQGVGGEVEDPAMAVEAETAAQLVQTQTR